MAIIYRLDEGDWQLRVYFVESPGAEERFIRVATGEERGAFEAGEKYGFKKARQVLVKRLDTILGQF